MLLLTTHDLRGTVVIDITGAEDRLLVVRSVRCKLLQIVVQFLGDILEVHLFLNFQGGLRLFGEDMLVDILLETTSELWDILDFQRETYGIGMSSEVLQQITTTLHSVVDIIACYTACRTCGQIAATGEYHRRTIVHFRHSRCHDAYHTLLPVLIVEHDTVVVLLTLQLLDDLVGLLRHLLVHILALLVVDIDVVGFCQRFLEIALHQQVDGFRTVLHTS